MKKKSIIALAIILTVLVIDQIIKIYIKTHFYLHESYEVTSWFYLAFTENNGMAFGVELFDKFLLTSFRIIAVAFFTYILAKFIRKDMVSMGFTIVMSMIIAGAMGNIFDCVFYGRIFTDSHGQVAQWADPANGLMGYGEWFRGLVVDMFYFPLFHFSWPEWFPHTREVIDWGWLSFTWPSWAPTCDREFVFFSPVFNFADAAISVGVFLMLVCYPKTFMSLMNNGEEEEKITEK